MARFRRSFRSRRGSGLRWFIPNLWSGNRYNTVNLAPTVPATGPDYVSDTSYTRLLSGSAPFSGVNNAAGILTGRILAQRQFWQLRRIVGRLTFAFSGDSEFLFSAGAFMRVHWAIVRAKVNENGQPDEDTFINLVDPDEQDDKQQIIYQDVWQTDYPPGTTLGADEIHHLGAAPPLYSMIDIKTKRPVGNEQDVFLATQLTGFAPFNNGFTVGTEIVLRSYFNLRVLGKFYR